MRYSPYENEHRSIPAMADQERLEYLLTRCFETDEIWYLAERGKRMTIERGASSVCPIWPYKRFAAEAALDHWLDAAPTGISLEFFIDRMLPELAAEGLWLDIIPRGEQPGALIEAGKLLAIFEGMQDAGEYRLDG